MIKDTLEDYIFEKEPVAFYIDGNKALSGENCLRTNEKRGLICFSDIAGWSDATGHFSLYDGTYRDYPDGCYDHGYFDHAPRNILFWEIPD